MVNIERIINELLHKMIDIKASDLHMDLKENKINYRFRRHKHLIYEKVNHVVEVYFQLKYISGIDYVSNQTAQTGSFSYIINNRTYYFRFAIIENNLRKVGVLRALNLTTIDSLESCINDDNIYKEIIELVKINHGIILFSGKTGSGKSTTMYHFLDYQQDQQVYSLENPIEIINDNFIQIEINHQLTFNQAFVQVLRHDPDIISLTEVRSKEELKTLLAAGLTGHRVCSTIHASGPETIFARMIDMGASLYDIKNSLKAVIHQNLFIDDKGDAHAEFIIYDSQELEKILIKEKAV